MVDLNKFIENFDKAYDQESPKSTDDLRQEYLEFSRFFQNAFISEDGWIINTGNFQTCNRQLIRLVNDKIKKHPLLWKLFFMVE